MLFKLWKLSENFTSEKSLLLHSHFFDWFYFLCRIDRLWITNFLAEKDKAKAWKGRQGPVGLMPEVLHSLLSSVSSVTRMDDLLDFGQLFKAFGNN